MATCTTCQTEIGVFARAYPCTICNTSHCDNCCANSSYVSHLQDLDPRIREVCEKSGYVCKSCLEQISDLPKGWEECLIDRRCAHHGCNKDLSSAHTHKYACAHCGLYFCDSHTRPLAELGPSIAKGLKKWDSEYICLNCTPKHQAGLDVIDRTLQATTQHLERFTESLITKTGKEADRLIETAETRTREIINYAGEATDERLVKVKLELGQEADRLLENIEKKSQRIIDHADQVTEKRVTKALLDLEEAGTRLKEQVSQKAQRGYVLLGLRVSLVAFAVFILVTAGPKTVHLAREGSFAWKLLWNATTTVSASLYLGFEFVRPGFKDPETRPYAIGFLIAVAFTCLHLLLG